LCPRQSHRTLLLWAPLLGRALAKVAAVQGKPFYAASTNYLQPMNVYAASTKILKLVHW
jgi:hypothetical protein